MAGRDFKWNLHEGSSVSGGIEDGEVWLGVDDTEHYIGVRLTLVEAKTLAVHLTALAED